MKKFMTIIILTCCITGCIGMPIVPRRISPDMSNTTEHTIKISDNVVKFSLPKGYHQYDYEAFKTYVDINDESLYERGPEDLLGGANWDWQPKVNVNGSLKLRISLVKFNDSGTTLREIYYNWLVEMPDPDGPQYQIDPAILKNYYRLKDVRKYRAQGPSFFAWDWSGAVYSATESETNEVFIYPLDNIHYLRIQFGVIDNSHGKPENQYWYAEAEDMVDQIMASITIDTGAEAATIEYGVPDLGLVKPGTLKYFDDISVR